MCIVSYVGDEWKTSFPTRWPEVAGLNLSTISREEFERYKRENEKQINDLKNEIVELKKLLLAAKEYDKKTGQPDCETGDKVALIKKIAALVGVDMNDVFFDDIKIKKE